MNAELRMLVKGESSVRMSMVNTEKLKKKDKTGIFTF